MAEAWFLKTWIETITRWIKGVLFSVKGTLVESFFLYQFARASARKESFSAESDNKVDCHRSRGSLFMAQSWQVMHRAGGDAVAVEKRSVT